MESLILSKYLTIKFGRVSANFNRICIVPDAHTGSVKYSHRTGTLDSRAWKILEVIKLYITNISSQSLRIIVDEPGLRSVHAVNNNDCNGKTKITYRGFLVRNTSKQLKQCQLFLVLTFCQKNYQFWYLLADYI